VFATLITILAVNALLPPLNQSKLPTSLFEEDDHGVSNVEADVAPVVVGDGVAALLDDEAVPVALELVVELLFDFARHV